MKVVSWNVNGLRATLKSSGRGLRALLDSLQADIICMQETKATRDQLDSSTYAAEGYNAYFSFCRTKSGYSGVVTFCCSSATPCAAEEGLTGVLGEGREDSVGCHGQWKEFTPEELTALDAEGRAVLTEHICGEEEGGRVVVVNVYCPRVDSDNPSRLDYKLRFYAALQERCTALERAGKLVVAVGDFNCSREAIDSAYILEDPSLLHGSPSREVFQQFVISHPFVTHGSIQLVDTFRYLHPTEEKAYTCWSTITDARKTNYGTRIDYVLASLGLVEHLRTSGVWQHVEGSDHCPVFAEFSLPLSPSPHLPSLCSNHFVEFAGKQQKLSAFLTRREKPQDSTGTPHVTTQHTSSSSKKLPVKRTRRAQDTLPSKLIKTSRSMAGSSSQTLLSFFKKTQQEEELEMGENLSQHDDGSSPKLSTLGSQNSGSDDKDSQQTVSSSLSPDDPSLPEPEEFVSQVSSQQQLSEVWRSVLTGPPKPPLCKGHSEPCVLRTVKKAGPNQRRQFWVCARPGGSKDDPKARCDFFKWVTKAISKK